MAITQTTPSSATASILARRPCPAHNLRKPTTFPSPPPAPTSSLGLRVRASKPRRESKPETLAPNSTSISPFQEADAGYLWKLALGSVIGAGVIKYGCIVFPDITRPDLVQALLLVFAPVFASSILLALASSQE